MGVCISQGVNFFLVTIYWEAGVSGVHIDFSSKICSMQFNCLFRNSGVRGMLNEKDFCAVEIVFPTVGASIDRATGV